MCFHRRNYKKRGLPDVCGRKHRPGDRGSQIGNIRFQYTFLSLKKKEEVQFLHNEPQRFQSGGNKNRDQSHLNQWRGIPVRLLHRLHGCLNL